MITNNAVETSIGGLLSRVTTVCGGYIGGYNLRCILGIATYDVGKLLHNKLLGRSKRICYRC